MLENILKSLLHNAGVLIVGFVVAFLGTILDSFFGLDPLKLPFMIVLAWLLFMAGFLLRVWATFYFYQNKMKVVSLKPQRRLITSGPYSFSRNPLYLGGNVFIFFGASLLLGSPMGLIITALHLPLMDVFIKREEKQLEQTFGEGWIRYKKKVHRWL
jgi:protein-S-isoprenylcysteine O-methyltransferase Ste14